MLDKAVVIREVGFYALGILLLYLALQDRRPDEDDKSGEEHIYISFFSSCLVFGGYILYVIVCANMDSIVKFFSKTSESLTSRGTGPLYGTMAPQGSRSQVRYITMLYMYICVQYIFKVFLHNLTRWMYYFIFRN